MDIVQIDTSRGFAEAEREQVAALYWEAFGDKLGKVLDARFVARVLDPRFALVARAADGSVLGVAGFKTQAGALVGGGWNDLTACYGWFGAAWRVVLLGVLERNVDRGTLLMDGICVAPGARGRGVGKRLLSAIKAEAKAQGYRAVRLDVIDSNGRAQALYAREGFEAGAVQHLGPLRHVFGFRSAREMIFRLD